MRLLLMVCLLLGVATLGTAQNERRERLRSLISAARGGDPEARKALQGLRSQLQQRKSDGSRRRPTSRDEDFAADSVTTFKPSEQMKKEKEQIHKEVESSKLLESVQEVGRRAGGRVLGSRGRQDEEPHRAINKGLEVDNRSEVNAVIRVTNRTRTPPIETIRRYSYFDQDGAYVFGYEAADGSYKEEKRGKDCVVHGKYGYVDPDGVKREYTYISGNRCDPNASTHPSIQEERAPLPKNDQFHIQTQEQQLDESSLSRLNFNRRRKPSEDAISLSEPKFSRREPEPISSPIQQQRQPEPPRSPSLAKQPFKASAPIQARKPSTFQTIVPIQPQIAKTTPTTIRPSPPPPLVFPPLLPNLHLLDPEEFDFDEEFGNLFQFANHRFSPEPARRSHQSSIPAPSRRTLETPQPPQQPAVPLKKEPHQLVFDAASGAFKTVPLSNLVTGAPKAVQQGDRELLPTIPFGPLKFTVSQQEFENFFS